MREQPQAPICRGIIPKRTRERLPCVGGIATGQRREREVREWQQEWACCAYSMACHCCSCWVPKRQGSGGYGGRPRFECQTAVLKLLRGWPAPGTSLYPCVFDPGVEPDPPVQYPGCSPRGRARPPGSMPRVAARGVEPDPPVLLPGSMPRVAARGVEPDPPVLYPECIPGGRARPSLRAKPLLSFPRTRTHPNALAHCTLHTTPPQPA